MCRRTRIFKTFVLVLTLVFFLSGCGTTEEVRLEPPNIIYIMADDLGYAELGSYGQELIETPNIDSLAKNGMRFTQHYSGAPVCAPSRCVLMTGKHAGHAHIRGNDEWRERGDVWNFAAMVDDPNLEGQRPIPEGTETVGRILQREGYKTAIVGKWGLGGPLTEGIPNLQGFDFFYGYNCQRQAHTFFPKHLWKNEKKVWLKNELVEPRTKLDPGADPNNPASYSKFWLEDYSAELMLEETLQFLEQNKGGRFFLYYATPIPHVPLQAPERWVKYYNEKFGEEEPYLGDQGYFPHRTPRAAYAAMVSYLDEQVGVMVEKLKEMGVYENTLILFTSDNGPTYAGGADSSFFNSAEPFQTESGRIKGSVHEGGIRVPLIASWPNRIKAGTTTDHISAFYDFLPTACELVGVPAPEDIDGISYAPTLLGSQNQKVHDFLYWEFPAYGGQQAVRMGKWKGVRTNILKEGNLEIQLYDLEQDPREEKNLAAERPEVVSQIEEILKREHTVPEILRFRMEALGDPIPEESQSDE